MSFELMNTKEVAQYLDIHEKQVYGLIKAGRIPSTRVTGKWIFPRKLIDEWIEGDALTAIKQVKKNNSKTGTAIIASGSNDPIMDMLVTTAKKTHPDFYIFSANTGSINGLKALNEGHTDVAFSHLFDPESSKYNLPFVADYAPDIDPVIVNLFQREIGFLIHPQKKSLINDFDSLTKKGIRFVNRQKGSGTRQLLDLHLQKKGIDPGKISGYEKEVYTHFEVGLSILSGEADTGMGSAAVGKLLGLEFKKITSECFDMILDRATYFQPGIQSFIEALKSDIFQSRVEKIGGYDFKDSGKIIYSKQ